MHHALNDRDVAEPTHVDLVEGDASDATRLVDSSQILDFADAPTVGERAEEVIAEVLANQAESDSANARM